MTKLNIKVKKLHPDAKLPTYATDGSGAFDIYGLVTYIDDTPVDGESLFSGDHAVFRTGLSFEIPDGYAMFIYSRSGQGFKDGIRLSNCTGIIDSDYRGEVKVKLHKDANHEPTMIKNLDRIAQGIILPVPKASFEEVNDLNDTERGAGGFGSTGA